MSSQILSNEATLCLSLLFGIFCVIKWEQEHSACWSLWFSVSLIFYSQWKWWLTESIHENNALRLQWELEKLCRWACKEVITEVRWLNRHHSICKQTLTFLPQSSITNKRQDTLDRVNNNRAKHSGYSFFYCCWCWF